jgi:hypothetical protein
MNPGSSVESGPNRITGVVACSATPGGSPVTTPAMRPSCPLSPPQATFPPPAANLNPNVTWPVDDAFVADDAADNHNDHWVLHRKPWSMERNCISTAPGANPCCPRLTRPASLDSPNVTYWSFADPSAKRSTESEANTLCVLGTSTTRTVCNQPQPLQCHCPFSMDFIKPSGGKVRTTVESRDEDSYLRKSSPTLRCSLPQFADHVSTRRSY